ncbi:hypothetical protein JCM10213_003355 [Rhodosporidiobolus nylandii]
MKHPSTQLQPDDPLLTLTHPPESGRYLRNWSSTYNHRPSLFFSPVSTAEVALILREATRRGEKVRVVGEHASPGPVWHGSWIISTQHFTSFVLLPPSTKRVRLGAGLKLRDVNPLLASHGLAFPTVGSLPDVSVGAYFAGPEHGSSAFHSVCASRAVSARIVLPTGEVREIKRGEELFRAAGAGVGAVGVVTEIEWELEEAFGLEVRMERVRLEDYLEDGTGRALWELARSSEFVKLWHFPTPSLLGLTRTNTILWRARRVPLPPPAQPSLLASFQPLLTRALHGMMTLFTLYVYPPAQKWVNALLYWSGAWGLPRTETARSYEAQQMDCLYNQLVDEWVVPFPAPSSPTSSSAPSPSSPAPANPATALLSSLLTYLHSPAGQKMGLHAPLEIRFNACEKPGEEFYLSSSAPVRIGEKGETKGEERDLVMWVEPIVFRPFNLPTPARFYRFFEVFESLFRNPPTTSSSSSSSASSKTHPTSPSTIATGRPHWCKSHFPTSPAELSRMFGSQNVEAFHRARLEVDKEGVMWNEWWEERVPTPRWLLKKAGEDEKGGLAHGRSEREGKRSGRWADVMGSAK